jgi:hypothetical protein
LADTTNVFEEIYNDIDEIFYETGIKNMKTLEEWEKEVSERSIRGSSDDFIKQLQQINVLLIKLTKPATEYDFRHDSHGLGGMNQKIKCMKGYIASMHNKVMEDLVNEN